MKIENEKEFQDSLLNQNYENNPENNIDDADNCLKSPVFIRDNYLLDPVYNKTKSYTATRLIHVNENSHIPKLYDQLIGQNRQKSFGYNILVLICFNINIAHFCFPYITWKCGLLLSFAILILCGIFSYIVQNSLIQYISHERGANQCNYAVIIENHFGSFCASSLETSVLLWYGIMLLVCLVTVKRLIFQLFLTDTNKVQITIGYCILVYFFTLFINRINSTKLIDFDVFFCIIVHFLSLIFYIGVFIYYFTNNPDFGHIGDLFNFSELEFFDAFNFFTGSLNTIIIFFWVNHKLSDSSVNKHSGMFKVSFSYITIYYILFIILKFFPVDPKGFRKKFILCPDIDEKIGKTDDVFYYVMMSEIILNIVNQIFMLNFYFLVIKNLIVRPTHAIYFKRKNYFIWFSIYLAIIVIISLADLHPYFLLILNNGTVGFVINYLIPSFLFIKLSSEKFLSFQIISKISLVFIFCVLTLTSFYKQILNTDLFNEIK